MDRRAMVVVWALLLWSGAGMGAVAQKAKPGAKEPSEPGMIVTFSRDGGGGTDVRIDRMAAVYVPQGTAPTPFTRAGAFAVMYEGDMNVRLRDSFSFSAAGRGVIQVEINGEGVFSSEGEDFSKTAATKPIQLNKGRNHLVIRYKSPASGDAFFRIYWSGEDFPAEPVPPMMLTHNPTAPNLQAGVDVREGRALFADLKCIRCHGPRMGNKGGGMPELMAEAPSFDGIGSRLNETFIAYWISNPQALRPTARMPRVFHEGDAGDGPALEGKARDLAAYLATLKSKEALKGAATSDELSAAGGRLFAHLKCIGCHTLPDADQFDADNSRIPLAYVKAKYTPGALWAFLKKPQAHYGWIRMPDFHLTDVEADRLTAFLLSRQQKSLELPDNAPQGDAKRGEALLGASGCLNCHTLTGSSSSLKVAPLSSFDKSSIAKGCLAEMPAAGAPDFHLTTDQRRQLGAFAGTDFSSLGRDNPAEFAARQVKELRCNACHMRDDEADLASQVDGEVASLVQDEGQDDPQGDADERIAPDQSLPSLTWVGEKLRPEWTARLLGGELDYRLRPWLLARMPAFSARAGGLAAGLAMEHGFSPVSPPDPKPDEKLAQIGKTLTGKEGGFSCVSCHGVGAMKPVGVFEAPGVNYKYVKERLTHHYYTRWVYNPMRINRDTKMPTFADSAGQTSLKETLGGDARKQYEAIWQYLLSGREIQSPEN